MSGVRMPFFGRPDPADETPPDDLIDALIDDEPGLVVTAQTTICDLEAEITRLGRIANRQPRNNKWAACHRRIDSLLTYWQRMRAREAKK